MVAVVEADKRWKTETFVALRCGTCGWQMSFEDIRKNGGLAGVRQKIARGDAILGEVFCQEEWRNDEHRIPKADE